MSTSAIGAPEFQVQAVEPAKASGSKLSGYPDQTEVMKRLKTLEASNATEDPKHKSEIGKAAISVVDSLRPAGIIK